MTKGQGQKFLGVDLETSLSIAPGDFIYVPAEAVHQPVNDGVEPLELIVARNTPVEIVVEAQPGKAKAPRQ